MKYKPAKSPMKHQILNSVLLKPRLENPRYTWRCSGESLICCTSPTLSVQFLIWSTTVQTVCEMVHFQIVKTPNYLQCFICSAFILKMKQSIACCIFFFLFRTNLCSCLSFSLYFNMFAYVCVTTEWPEFSFCSLPLKHVLPNTDQTSGKQGFTCLSVWTKNR